MDNKSVKDTPVYLGLLSEDDEATPGPRYTGFTDAAPPPPPPLRPDQPTTEEGAYETIPAFEVRDKINTCAKRQIS